MPTVPWGLVGIVGALLACGGSADEATQARIYCEVVAAHPRTSGGGAGPSGPLSGLAGGAEQQRLMAIVTEVRERFREAGISEKENLMTRLSTLEPSQRSQELRKIVEKAGLESVCQAALAEM